MIPTAQRNTRQSGAGLKILSAGSTLYGLRRCAEMFGRERGIPVQVATDHGHHIHQAALRGEADADVVLLPAAVLRRTQERRWPMRARVLRPREQFLASGVE